MNNFKITNCDTDSISFCKEDMSNFTEEEINSLHRMINDISPELITWEPDGYFNKFVVLKAKNYIMYDGKKVKLKGSSLKSSTLEPAIKGMLNEMISCIIHNNANHGELVYIYNKYVYDVSTITDMKPWAKKITISTKTIESTRANEKKIIDALNRSNVAFSEGDKFYVFFKEDGSLDLLQNFKGEYDKDVFLEKVFKATDRFKTILPTKELFKNYSLKRNKKELEGLLECKKN